ncbi:ribose 5-phosphate isomerase B [Helicobacter sp. T3_23-1056]
MQHTTKSKNSQNPTQNRKIYIACDHAGFELKEFVKKYFSQKEEVLFDLGVDSTQSVDYADFAQNLCKKMLECNKKDEKNVFGILICGSGIGMSISANRFVGIRASLCTSAYMAHITRMHNDANVLCLGARISGQGEVESILEAFFASEFEGGRHARRIDKIERFSDQ